MVVYTPVWEVKVPTALARISFDVISVIEKLTTRNYQELTFCGPNNNDFIAHDNQSPIASIGFPLSAGRWCCCGYSDCCNK